MNGSRSIGGWGLGVVWYGFSKVTFVVKDSKVASLRNYEKFIFGE